MRKTSHTRGTKNKPSALTTGSSRRSANRFNKLDRLQQQHGNRTVQKLLRHFGSSERVRAASEEELAKMAGPAAARRIREYYALHEGRV